MPLTPARLVMSLIAIAALGFAAAPSSARAAEAGTALVTGANRGMGLEFVRQLAADGWTVIATARKPEEATALQAMAKADRDILIETLDVSDLPAIDALAAKYKDRPIDLLVNNAGTTGRPQTQNFGTIDYATFDDVMQSNVRGPLKMTEAFTANLAASRLKKVLVVSSSEGSIGQVNSSRQVFYRGSKAAVNMIMKNISYPLKEKGIAVALINPGPVDTDMMAAARGRIPLRSPELAVKEMRAIVDKMTLAETGTFWNFDGKVLPW
jgi:NAD(P)-dependent dehydrogenase (short-subunit alcohol dehydrogenase family)